jgi:predicted dehydrogenase
MTKIGIIGTGWGARVQVPAFRAAGLEVVAIAGHDSAKTKRIAAESALTSFPNWRDLVASDVDLVTIVTPPSTHREMAIAALRAGKHVLSEKPTAMNVAEAEEMLSVAAEHPQQLALIDHELRFLPAWREARKLVVGLGGVRSIEMRYSSSSRGDRAREWNWWSDASQGGGVLGAVGSHGVDAMRYLTGLEVLAVQAVLHTFIARRPFGDRSEAVTADDFAAIHFQLTNGALATMTFTVVAAVDEPTVLTIHGEHGGVRLQSSELWYARRGEKFERVDVAMNAPENLAGDSSGGAFGTGTYYLGLALQQALSSSDRSALAPAATFQDGVEQQRVLDAVRAAQAEAGWKQLSR